jgi:hypothetical protein
LIKKAADKKIPSQTVRREIVANLRSDKNMALAP